MPAHTATTITRRVKLDEELSISRRRGWYEVRGESVAELHAIAVPLTVAGSQLALCVAGPVTRFETAREGHAKALMLAASKIQAKHSAPATRRTLAVGES